MELLLLPLLLWMAYWDFSKRSVLLWHLLVFGLIQIGICIYKYGLILSGWNTLTNMAILFIIGGAVGVYSFFRFKGKQKPLGMGDIVFICLLTPYFEYRPFLYFLISSFILTLITWVVWRMVRRKETDTIPLISGVGICYALLLVYNSFVPLW